MLTVTLLHSQVLPWSTAIEVVPPFLSQHMPTGSARGLWLNVSDPFGELGTGKGSETASSRGFGRFQSSESHSRAVCFDVPYRLL